MMNVAVGTFELLCETLSDTFMGHFPYMMSGDCSKGTAMFQPIALHNDMARRFGSASTNAPRAQQLFDRALRTAQVQRLGAALFARSRRLLDLAGVEAEVAITGRHAVGAQTVALDDIRGSLDKAGDFDREFYPLSERSESRWVRVATAMLRDVTLPPVELIRVGDVYFVVDGHHRISAARALKHSHIDAVVTEWTVAG
jgi:hypothetical protein